MSRTPPRQFRSSGKRGFLTAVRGDPRHVTARKLERQVQVRFVDTPGTVQTPEGVVHTQPGDAVLTGIAGEHWRVSHAHFADKYRPATGTAAGEDGAYVSLPNQILALRMPESFEVLLADGVSRLQGHRGDWLVDYGDGSLGIVTEAIFSVTYEIVSPPP